jgi:hypothetical protein
MEKQGMTKLLWIVNIFCIVGMGAALIWAGLGLRNGQFEERHAVVWLFLAPCLLFVLLRKCHR